jgi:hypothetical protein
MSSILYLVRTMSVYLYNITAETFGTGVAVSNLQGANFDPQHDTDMLKILGAIEESLSVMTHLTVGLSFGGLDWPSLAVMTGTDDSSSGAETHRNDDDGGEDLPYFGAAFALPLKSGREAHIYLPKCQLTKRPAINVSEQNKFAIPDIEMIAMRLRLAAGTTLPVRKYKEVAANTALPTTTFGTSVGIP